MRNRRARLVVYLGTGIAIMAVGALSAFAAWASPCWVSDRVGYLSRRCAIDQIAAVVGSKNLEVIEISRMSITGKGERKVRFRSRLIEPFDDDSANVVFVDSVIFRSVNHKWRLDSSTLHW